MTNNILMVRIYLSEADHGRRRTLMQEILTLLQERHAVQGVTVFRGIAGFGEVDNAEASEAVVKPAIDAAAGMIGAAMA